MEYYVYQLIDSQNERPFYIGKGQKLRMYAHVKDVQRGRIPNKTNTKLGNKIKKIVSSGYKIKYKKIFLTEIGQEAYDKEKELIAEIGLKNLCNLTEGGKGGIRGVPKGTIPWNKGLTKENSKEWAKICEIISKVKTGKHTGKRVEYIKYKCKNSLCNNLIKCEPSLKGHKKYCNDDCRIQHRDFLRDKRKKDFVISNCNICKDEIKTFRQLCGKLIPRKWCDDCTKEKRKELALLATKAEQKKFKTDKRYRMKRLKLLRQMSESNIMRK